MTLLIRTRELHNQALGLLQLLASPALLSARLYIAWVFFKAGLTKINNWESTLFLFEYEYQVPYLSIELAAQLATFGELVLPVLLALGLLTRISAIGLFIVNVVAVIAYLDISLAAYNLHLVWGVIILANIIYGGGKLALDHKLKID